MLKCCCAIRNVRVSLNLRGETVKFIGDNRGKVFLLLMPAMLHRTIEGSSAFQDSLGRGKSSFDLQKMDWIVGHEARKLW